MREHAALADEPEAVQPIDQRCTDLRSLANQHQGFRVLQSLGQRIDILHVIVPDFDVVSFELAETGQGAQRVVVVVKN